MKRRQIVAGNWKMNMDFESGRRLALDIVNSLGPTECSVVLCPPFIHLNYLSSILTGIANLHLGAQNCFYEKSGAFTGEISAPMLKSVGVEFVIVGHSERRSLFHESDEVVARKVSAVLDEGLTPIFCCGEPLEVRNKDQQDEWVKAQIEKALFGLDGEQLRRVVIAYEPVWAIGTGKNATPQQAQQMHAHIRKLIAKKFDGEIAASITILYGGSCKPDNAAALFSQPDIDGGLIGGASLNAADFVAIVNSIPN
ncbi:MAG: hypothetical protein KatS3mg029_0493 [Saprospiraceae bacterium]|nr:MAG: hypothetical protein KatS3mg029_0493 [Saprospiraceae bacterium]